MPVCGYCKTGRPRFELERQCCRVRFLAGLPTKEVRAGWLCRWEDRMGRDVADADRMALRMLWPRRAEGIAVVLAELMRGE